MMRRLTDAMLCGCAFVAACSSGGGPPIPSAQMLLAVKSSLASGDIELAEQLLERALARYPDDGSVKLWSAELAAMRWDDAAALQDLMLVRATEDRGGFAAPELDGKIGDLLFRMGRYGESVAFLNAGQVGTLGADRKAWAEIAQHLPFVRRTPDIEVAELPLIAGDLPQLACAIGDVQQAFVLDTRATFTTLANSLAAELPVTPIVPAGQAIDGTGRSFPSSVGVLGTLSLGGVDIGAQPVLVVEDRALTLRDPFGGPERSPRALIGQDVLRRFRVTFDPTRQSVVLQKRRGLDERQSQPCLWAEENMLVAVSIEGRQLWFALDTGASASSLSVQGLRALPGGERRALESFRRVYGPGGVQFSVRTVQGLVVTVSEVRFRGVDLAVIDRAPSKVFPVHGVLGADLLLKCRTTLDGGRIRLEPL